MKQIQLIQNSQEWYAFRKNKIGASDANIIMGVSKFMTPAQLFEEKKNPTEKESNFIQEKGHKKEVKARARIELMTGLEYQPLTAVHSDFEWLMASLDGYNEQKNQAWECKFVGKEHFEKVKNGEMLDHYWPQVQTQLVVSGAESVLFTVISEENEIASVTVKPDIEYIQTKLFPALISFHEKMASDEKPDLTDRDTVDFSDNSDLEKLLNEYKILKDSSDRLEDVKKKIFDICKRPKIVCNGIKITTSKGKEKSVIDYDAILKDFSVDVEKYTSKKDGAITRRITFPS